MSRGLYMDDPEDANDVQHCIAMYMFDNTDTGKVIDEVYDYITNNSDDAFRFQNRDIDIVLDDLRSMDIDVPDVKDMNELYEIMEGKSDDDMDTYYEVLGDFDLSTADAIVNGYDSWGTYHLPYDMADLVLGNNGAAQIYAQCEKDGNFSEKHVIDIFKEQYLGNKTLEDIAFETCIEVEIPRLLSIRS